jgi:2-oxoglutarate dehydrogenase E2 component (dihydrolipoamide succinyltransferase)
MSIEIKAPSFPESISEGTVATWYKQPGDAVSRDELIVDIETDKVVLEIVAPANGSISNVFKTEGDTVLSGEVIAEFSAGAAIDSVEHKTKATTPASQQSNPSAVTRVATMASFASPAAHKLIKENHLDSAMITGSGKAGRITKEDVLTAIAKQSEVEAKKSAVVPPAGQAGVSLNAGRPEQRVAMTRLRSTIAKRLLEAQQNAAMLTTYSEVNMQPIIELRNSYKVDFAAQHDGVKLGFMSFFVKAATEALKRFPAVNASIDGQDIVYHGYQDIGVAVSTDRGLVVPVLRNAQGMSLANIEIAISHYAEKARAGKLAIEDMTGGTFTLSNGGVFGSLLSTPILNPPQTAILGMHKIQERPVAVEGKVVIQAMMYLALSYDHRMIDGREAVQFLDTIKDLLEDPTRILLQI